MVVMDSSGWLELFLQGPRAEIFEPYLQKEELLVPATTIYEVYRLLRRQKGKMVASLAAAQMTEHRVVDTTESIAIAAAEVSIEYGLAMADAIIYATARGYEARLVTSDFHFAQLPGVTYVPKPEVG